MSFSSVFDVFLFVFLFKFTYSIDFKLVTKTYPW
nr:MAG TPA: hypothetical protein [Bacteriophage sp.]